MIDIIHHPAALCSHPCDSIPAKRERFVSRFACKKDRVVYFEYGIMRFSNNAGINCAGVTSALDAKAASKQWVGRNSNAWRVYAAHEQRNPRVTFVYAVMSLLSL